jgi:hypothetical protein
MYNVIKKDIKGRNCMPRYIVYIILVLLAVVCVVTIMIGYPGSGAEGFAIYLTKDDILPARMDALSKVDIASEPIISQKDIISYNAETHEINLTGSAFKRISSLELPVRGKSFLICVNKSPLYWGAFWTPLSSLSFNGVIIMKPLDSQKPYMITISLGYPALSAFEGVDPRNNETALKALKNAGKLVR